MAQANMWIDNVSFRWRKIGDRNGLPEYVPAAPPTVTGRIFNRQTSKMVQVEIVLTEGEVNQLGSFMYGVMHRYARGEG